MQQVRNTLILPLMSIHRAYTIHISSLLLLQQGLLPVLQDMCVEFPSFQVVKSACRRVGNTPTLCFRVFRSSRQMG